MKTVFLIRGALTAKQEKIIKGGDVVSSVAQLPKECLVVYGAGFGSLEGIENKQSIDKYKPKKAKK